MSKGKFYFLIGASNPSTWKLAQPVYDCYSAIKVCQGYAYPIWTSKTDYFFAHPSHGVFLQEDLIGIDRPVFE